MLESFYAQTLVKQTKNAQRLKFLTLPVKNQLGFR